jgi:hypothetical protein
MAMKRHRTRKLAPKSVVRGHSARLTHQPDYADKFAIPSQTERGAGSIAPDVTAPDVTAQDVFNDATPADKHAARVMLVIMLCGLAYIGFVAWCVTGMPEK